MGSIEKEKFEDFVKAMTKEEMEIAVRHIDMDILWDGIRKRETENRRILNCVKELVV